MTNVNDRDQNAINPETSNYCADQNQSGYANAALSGNCDLDKQASCMIDFSKYAMSTKQLKALAQRFPAWLRSE